MLVMYISSTTMVELVCAAIQQHSTTATAAATTTTTINATVQIGQKLPSASGVQAARPIEIARPARNSTGAIGASNSTTDAKQAAKSKRDQQTEASLLRPSFMRGLLRTHKRPTDGKQTEAAADDDMEEVTQTIMVPMGEPTGGSDKRHANRKRKSTKTAGAVKPFGQAPSDEAGHHTGVPSSSLAQLGNDLGGAGAGVHPLAEASLQLTSTEIGGLLNDREAPEFYRERELNGDGIMVGEEPVSRLSAAASGSSSRLGMAASGPFSSQFMGDYGPAAGMAGGFDAGENGAAMYRQRLMQAASEEGFGGGGFNHRFGQQSFGAGSDQFGGQMNGPGGGGGGLMQSPNEYSEVNSYGSTGGFGQYPGQAGDYSPQSGLLRAGSEIGGPYDGGAFNGGPMGGGGGSVPLEAAAAGYSGGGEFGASMGEFGGGGGAQGSFYGGGAPGRLQAHASYNPYMAAAGEPGDYASRFGYQGANSFGMGDQRGFASQNSHQIMSQRLQQAGSRGHGNRLMPLTPVVPLAEELAGVTQPSVMSSNQRDQVAPLPGAQMMRSPMGAERGPQQMASQQQQQQQQQHVHEAFEDDPTDVSQDESDTPEQGHDGGLDVTPVTSSADISGTMMTTPMSSMQREQLASGNGGGRNNIGSGYGPSFVLNVPPPGVEQTAMANTMQQQQQQQQQMSQRGLSPQQLVEFSRVGSAGYMGPMAMNEPPQFNSAQSPEQRSSMMSRKFGQTRKQQLQNDEQERAGDEQEFGGGGDEMSSSASSGADNPAHAGKYIIDK
jgi:hypothetical protein